MSIDPTNMTKAEILDIMLEGEPLPTDPTHRSLILTMAGMIKDGELCLMADGQLLLTPIAEDKPYYLHEEW
jgi:hypothetical protein